MRRKIFAGFKVFSKFLLLIAVGLGLLALVIFIPGSELRRWNLFRASNNWPSVMGTITKSGPSLYSQEGYDPMIYYEFEDRGKRCKSNNVQFSHAFELSASDADSLIAKYPVGSRVTVYYNPNSRYPCTNNILERVYKPDWVMLLVWILFSLMAAGVGLLCLVSGFGVIVNFSEEIEALSVQNHHG